MGSEWISVKDEMPDITDDPILSCDINTKTVWFCHYNEYGWTDHEGWFPLKSKHSITHWKKIYPLPEKDNKIGFDLTDAFNSMNKVMENE